MCIDMSHNIVAINNKQYDSTKIYNKKNEKLETTLKN